MGLRSKIQKAIEKEAMGLSQKAMEKLFADEGRAQKIAQAIGTVQRGKQAMDDTQRALMHSLSFATKADFKDLGKKLSALKRRVKNLEEMLSKA